MFTILALNMLIGFFILLKFRQVIKENHVRKENSSINFFNGIWLMNFWFVYYKKWRELSNHQ
jgi:hypothetical protein